MKKLMLAMALTLLPCAASWKMASRCIAACHSLRRRWAACARWPTASTAHEWLTWRRDLYQFAPLLFR